MESKMGLLLFVRHSGSDSTINLAAKEIGSDTEAAA